MSETILLAGATGNLGFKIAKALIKRKATVRAIVRHSSDPAKISQLTTLGISVIKVNMQDQAELSLHCTGVDCVVSALSGLQDVVLDAQKDLLDAAVAAKVPRFIPSDYSIDFTNLKPGKNRNLDLRRDFHRYLDQAPIKSTTIFNGAFMDLVSGDMPLILFKFNRVLYWGDPGIKFDLTTTDDVAEYTAAVAMDDASPRFLHIAGDSVNAKDVLRIMNEISSKPFKLFRPGSIGRLNSLIKLARFFSKNTKELYPAWQGMQYMRDMMEGRAARTQHDNTRYPGIKFTSLKSYLLSKPTLLSGT
jgi:uncharacterized protein YbjT (DUF2867 family)